jgi:hypothetical protein
MPPTTNTTTSTTEATTTSKHNNSIGYKHQDAKECKAFRTKLKSKIRQHHRHLVPLLDFVLTNTTFDPKSEEGKKLNIEFYDLIIENLHESCPLFDTLSNDQFEDNGIESLTYILACFDIGKDENKEILALEKFNKSLEGITRGMSAEDLRKVFNELGSQRVTLKGTDSEINDPQYCKIIKTKIMGLSQQYKAEVRHAEM